MKHRIEIDQKPKIVFDYIAQLEKHSEWQDVILESKKEPSGTTRKGTRNTELRQMPGGPHEVTAEVITYDPPSRIVAKTISNDLIHATISISVKPLRNGQASDVTFQADLTGRGIGKLFVIFARKSNEKQIPKNLKKLKKQLETAKSRYNL